MVLALAFHWRRFAIASASLLALGACETTTPGAPEQPAVESVDRSPRVASEIARGRQALAAGDLSSAQSAFTGALRGSPNDPEPAIGLAETYLAMGDLETAGRLFELVAGTGGAAGDARLLQGRGLVALGQGRTDEAIAFLERSVERDPEQWRAWAGLGRAYGRKGNSRQARSAFGRAEESAPSPAVVMNDMGMLHLEENEPAAALEAFQRALAVDPGNAIASANARIARAMLGEYDAAISGARPDELPDVLNNVGYIAVVNGDFDVADRFLRRAIDISPVYHEAASANLDLLAQAMRGVPVGTLAGPAVAAPRIAAGAELPASATAADPQPAEAAASPADGGSVVTDGWSAVLSGASGAAAPAEPLAERTADRPAGVPANLTVELASAPAQPAAEEGGVVAHGFRWDAQPQSAAPAKRRAKRKAAPAVTPPDAADTRRTAWPSISVPTAASAAEARPDAPRSEEKPDRAEQVPAEDGGAAAAAGPDLAAEGAAEAEGALSAAAEGSAAGSPE